MLSLIILSNPPIILPTFYNTLFLESSSNYNLGLTPQPVYQLLSDVDNYLSYFIGTSTLSKFTQVYSDYNARGGKLRLAAENRSLTLPSYLHPSLPHSLTHSLSLPPSLPPSPSPSFSLSLSSSRSLYLYDQ